MYTLSFPYLRMRNLERCMKSFHPLESWSLTDWATAVAGEVGEACNVIKKLRRIESHSGFAGNCEEVTTLKAELAKELADTVIYIDLLAARAGIDLAQAVRAKFNETSDRIASPVRL